MFTSKTPVFVKSNDNDWQLYAWELLQRSFFSVRHIRELRIGLNDEAFRGILPAYAYCLDILDYAKLDS